MLNTPSVTCTTCLRAPLGLCWWTVISGEGRSEPVTWQSRWYLACFLSNVFFNYTSFILNLISLVMMLLQNFCIMMTPVTRLASFKQMCMWQTDPSSPQDKRKQKEDVSLWDKLDHYHFYCAHPSWASVLLLFIHIYAFLHQLRNLAGCLLFNF